MAKKGLPALRDPEPGQRHPGYLQDSPDGHEIPGYDPFMLYQQVNS